MAKSYVKMNIDDNHLSYGNFTRIIKETSKNKTAAMQSEVFLTIFEVESVNDTTVNNYCVGIRSINDSYKQIYLNYLYKYKKDKLVLLSILTNLLSLIEGRIITTPNEELINTNDTIKYMCTKLFNIAKNDASCNEEIIHTLSKDLEINNLVDFLTNVLFFIILTKKQPLYEEERKKEIIEQLLSNTLISAKELEDYLTYKFNEKANFLAQLKELADSGNAYACYEIGMMEYKGEYMEYPRYIKAYDYFLKASKSNHPYSYYMLARLIYYKHIPVTDEDYKKAFEYVSKAIELGSIAGMNLLGLFYLNGITPVKKDIKKAEELFKQAAENRYPYSYNNLSIIHRGTQKEIEYLKKAAEFKEPWACNRLGEIERLKGNYKEAYDYYIISSEAPVVMSYFYSFYNLAKYYYLNGNKDAHIEQDIDKAINYFKRASKYKVIEASIELLYIYTEEYLKDKTEDNLKRIMNMKEVIENNPKFNSVYKKEIENNLLKIKNDIEINIDIIK